VLHGWCTIPLLGYVIKPKTTKHLGTDYYINFVLMKTDWVSLELSVVKGMSTLNAGEPIIAKSSKWGKVIAIQYYYSTRHCCSSLAGHTYLRCAQSECSLLTCDNVPQLEAVHQTTRVEDL
jgi:hypothetical protein